MDKLKEIWAEVTGWIGGEFKALSQAELALLKAEIPTLTKAAAVALEDFVIQEATALETMALSGPDKAASLGQTIGIALGAGLQVIGEDPLVAGQPLSTRAMNMLIEAGATAARIGIMALISGAV